MGGRYFVNSIPILREASVPYDTCRIFLHRHTRTFASRMLLRKESKGVLIQLKYGAHVSSDILRATAIHRGITSFSVEYSWFYRVCCIKEISAHM